MRLNWELCRKANCEHLKISDLMDGMEIEKCEVGKHVLSSWEHHEVPKECPYRLEALMESQE